MTKNQLNKKLDIPFPLDPQAQMYYNKLRAEGVRKDLAIRDTYQAFPEVKQK